MRTPANGHLNGRTAGGYQTNGQPQADQYEATYEATYGATYGDATAYQGSDLDDQDPARYQASSHRDHHQTGPATSGYGVERPTRGYDRTLSWDPAAELDLDDPSRTTPPPPLRSSPQVRPADRQQAGWAALEAPAPAPLRSLPPAALGPRLRVDWPHCKAHGLCHELLPEVVRLDEWGYPIIGDRPLPPQVLHDAKRAVMACPTLALHLVE